MMHNVSPRRPLSAALRAGGLALALVMAAHPLAAVADDGQMVLHTATGDHDFKVEVVDTNETRAKGLMFRKELAPDAGMLFDFKETRQTSFWMSNTLIPLDMVFISADGVVKTIHVNAKPLDLTAIPSQVPVQFVLEIPGGRSVEIGLKPGDKVEHTRIKPN